METTSIAGLGILIVTCLISYKGIEDYGFLDQYSFKINAILVHKDYKRLFTSGFLHADWPHLIFNMLTFYSFSSSLEMALGIPRFLALYFGSLLGGNLLALFIHRHDSRYSAVGASGAVSGLVFACIALFPGMELGLLFLPLSIPGWAFGLLYTLYTLYGIKSKKDNIGHEAHLGGGLFGLGSAILMFPHVLQENYLPILLIVVPSSVFLFLVITRPDFLLAENPFLKHKGVLTVDDKHNIKKRADEKELNELLEKINKKGIESLSVKEKERLEKLSNNK